VEELERKQTIPGARIADVFAFFSDPRNLARITPPWLSFRIVGDVPPRLEAGSRLEYRIRWTFWSLRWVTRITRWDPPHEFEDVQERGPYARWEHTHRFREVEGGVEMEDRVAYRLPFGPLGALVHRLRVRQQLEGIFDFRRREIERLFAGPPRA
jgi:ligand-binding SRPBCC domain-containing protein